MKLQALFRQARQQKPRTPKRQNEPSNLVRSDSLGENECESNGKTKPKDIDAIVSVVYCRASYSSNRGIILIIDY